MFIIGIGIGLPNVQAPITTESLLKVCNLGDDVNAEWIDSKIGAWQRYTATDCPFGAEYHPAKGSTETAKPLPPIASYAHPLRAGKGCLNSDISAEAVTRAIRDAGLNPEDIDLLIHSSCTPDYPTPPTSTIVQEKAGLKNHCHVMDVRSSCSGPTQSMQAAVALLKATPEYKYAVVCGADVGSIFGEIDKDVNPSQWSKGDVVNTALIGDGAGAFVISSTIPATSRCQPGNRKAGQRKANAYEIVDVLNGCMGIGCDKGMYLPCGGCVNPPSAEAVKKGLNKFSHSFSAVLSHGPRLYLAAVDKMMSRNQITLGDMKILVPHQANATVPQLAAKVGVDPNLIYSNFQRVGNTANASLYLCLWDLDRNVPSTDVKDYSPKYNDYATMLEQDDKEEKLDMGRPSMAPGDLVALISAESTKWLYGCVLLRVVDPAVAQAGSGTKIQSSSTTFQRAKLSFALSVAGAGLAARAWWRSGKGKKKKSKTRFIVPLTLLGLAAFGARKYFGSK